jgi:hypothetical protein
MAEPQVDSEFMQYWSRLTIVEKESLLIVARNYVQLKGQLDPSSGDARYLLVQQEREEYLKGEGGSYSWEEVKEMALDKKKRNGL